MFSRRAANLVRLVPALTVVLLIAAACIALPATPGSTPSAMPQTPSAEPTAAAAAATPPAGGAVVDAAREALGIELGVSAAEIRVISAEPVNWRDGCLEVSRPEMACLQAITPGYQYILEANGNQYEMRTNLDGTVVLRAGPHPAAGEPVLAVAIAIDYLATQLGLERNDVRVVSSEQVEWPDGCLGAAATGEMCAQVITPGYWIVLEANNEQYTLHTNLQGTTIRMAPGVGSSNDDGSLSIVGWRDSVAGECTDVFLSATRVKFGKCEAEQTLADYPSVTHRLAQLQDMAATYAPFAADTPAGKVAFNGLGPINAGPAEQRMVAEFAAAVHNEVLASGGVAQYGVGWRREGGIAGFCDDLAIEASGHATLRSCAAQPPREIGWRRLTETELARMYIWLDTLGSFEHRQTDAATADAMTTSFILAGRTEAQPAEGDKEAILAFGGEVLAQWAGPSDVRYVMAQRDVPIRVGPGDQFAQSGEVAGGQIALVTGVTQNKEWWRVVCPDDTVGFCYVPADPAATQPVKLPGAPGASPTLPAETEDATSGSVVSNSDEAAILSVVIRQVYTVDHTFGGTPNFPIIYLLRVIDAGTGVVSPFAATPVAVDPTLQAQIVTGLADLPAKFNWIADPSTIPRDATTGLVKESGAVISVGSFLPQADGSVHVAASIYVGSLAAGGQTYVVQKVGGAWEITGKTGPMWIS